MKFDINTTDIKRQAVMMEIVVASKKIAEASQIENEEEAQKIMYAIVTRTANAIIRTVETLSRLEQEAREME